MAKQFKLDDLKKPGVWDNLIRRTAIQLNGTSQERGDLLLADRLECDNRGYHLVSREPKDPSKVMICYDCELWFGKNDGIEYRVEPL